LQTEEVVSTCISQKDDRIALMTAEAEINVTTEVANKTGILENESKQPLFMRSRGRVPQIGQHIRTAVVLCVHRTFCLKFSHLLYLHG